MPWIFRDLFAAAGARMEDHLEPVRMRPLTRYTFADGTAFDYDSNLPGWLETVRPLVPADVDGFWRFLQLGARLFELLKDTFFRRTPLTAPDRQSPRALRHLPLRHGWGNYHATVAGHFKSPYLRQMFDRYPTYVGSSPYHAPATLAIIPYIEFEFGGWYVRGVLYSIVESLVRLMSAAGVSLRADSRVARITHDGKRATGVDLASGAHLDADVVVMNGDASCVPALLGSATAPGPRAADRSLSGMVSLMGLRHSLPDVAHHAAYFSGDSAREFHELFDARTFPTDPTVYVNVASRTDRSVVPGQGETVFIVANAPADEGQTWDAGQIADARARVFSRLGRGGFPDIESDAVVEDVWTPARIGAQYTMPGGSIYGTNSHGWKRAFLRPPNRDPRLAGLFYVGGSTHPAAAHPPCCSRRRSWRR